MNNCGEFRAVRDISVSPLSTGIDYKLINYKLQNQPGIRKRNRIGPNTASIQDDDKSGSDASANEEAQNGTVSSLENRPSKSDITTVQTINEVNR